MSYTVYRDNTERLVSFNSYNATAQLVGGSDDILRSQAESVGYEFENIADFRKSNNYKLLMKRYLPFYRYWHLLQNEPSNDEILDILKNAPSVSIMAEGRDNDQLDYYIALNSWGVDYTDCSDSIAFAYMVIDREIPKGLLFNLERITISKKGWTGIEGFLGKTKNEV